MEQMGAFLPLILIFGVFYLLLIRPQQKKVKQHRTMINDLKRGDKIITTGGIIGVINKVKDNKELLVEVSDSVEIQIASGMVHELYSKNDTQKQTPAKSLVDNKNDQKKGFLSGIFTKKN